MDTINKKRDRMRFYIQLAIRLLTDGFYYGFFIYNRL